MNFQAPKMWKFSRLADQLLASYEGLSSMQLVRLTFQKVHHSSRSRYCTEDS